MKVFFPKKWTLGVGFSVCVCFLAVLMFRDNVIKTKTEKNVVTVKIF